MRRRRRAPRARRSTRRSIARVPIPCTVRSCWWVVRRTRAPSARSARRRRRRSRSATSGAARACVPPCRPSSSRARSARSGAAVRAATAHADWPGSPPGPRAAHRPPRPPSPVRLDQVLAAQPPPGDVEITDSRSASNRKRPPPGVRHRLSLSQRSLRQARGMQRGRARAMLASLNRPRDMASTRKPYEDVEGG